MLNIFLQRIERNVSGDFLFLWTISMYLNSIWKCINWFNWFPFLSPKRSDPSGGGVGGGAGGGVGPEPTEQRTARSLQLGSVSSDVDVARVGDINLKPLHQSQARFLWLIYLLISKYLFIWKKKIWWEYLNYIMTSFLSFKLSTNILQREALFPLHICCS